MTRGRRRLAQAGLLTAGATLVGMALLLGRFRHVEGQLGSGMILPLAGGVALLVYGILAGGRSERPARWLALAVAGQGATLQLTIAGRGVGYQHLLPVWHWLERPYLAPTVVLLSQAAAVLWTLRGRWRGITKWIHERLSTRSIFVIAAVFILTSATLSREPATYVTELLVASSLQAVHLVTVVVAVISLPDASTARLGVLFDKLLGSTWRRRSGLDALAVAAALWVALTAALLAYFVYQRHPHVPDEVAYLLHARYFAEGRLTLAAPPVPGAFELDLMTLEPHRWFSPVPPGWPAVLALGVLGGVPWLVNPLLAGLNVLLVYVLVRKMYDRAVARLTILLLGASPWFLFMSMNFMTHTLSMTAGLVAALCVLRLRNGNHLAWALPGGAAAGMLALTRPLEGLVMAGLLGLWIGGARARPLYPRLRALAVFGLATAAVAAILLPYNAALTGEPLRFPLTAYLESQYGAGSNAFGFGPDRGFGWTGLDPLPGHGPLDVLVNASLNLFSLNGDLLGWSVGSLLPVVLLLSTRRLAPPDRWMLMVPAAIIAVHSLYWFGGGPDFGARYWYLALVPCLVFAVRGILSLERFGRSDPLTRARALTGGLALSCLALLTFIPWRAVDKYYHYRRMRPDIRRMVEAHSFDTGLVLVRGERHPDYASAAVYNPLDLRSSDPVFAWDRNADVRRAVLEAYRDRKVWLVNGPTVTGQGFEIVAGPLNAGRLLAGEDAAHGPPPPP